MRGKRCACTAQFHEKTRKRIASENMHLFLRVPERYKKAAIIISEKDGISLELRKNINISRIDIIIAIALIVTILFFFSSGLLFLSLLILFRLIQIKCEQKRQGIIPGTTQAKAGFIAGILSIAVGLDDKLLPVALLHRFYIGHLRHAGWHAHHTIWRYLWAVCHNVWYSRDTHQSFFI